MAKHLRDGTRQEDPYIFNNAANEEQIRVDEQSLALNILMHHKPIHASISNPGKILEIGYGTGLMCNLLAQKFPEAIVFGVDPSPPPDGFHDKLDNVEYIQGRYEDLLAAGDPRLELASFDYIFIRMAICWVTDWPSHINRIQSLLKPGAWVELQDVSLPIHFSGTDPHPVDTDWEWVKVVRNVCLKNTDCASGINLESRMNEGGFSDVRSVEYPFCVSNPWPGRPETAPVAEYTGKYVPLVFFGLLDQYAKDKYTADEIQQMKDSAMETAFSGKVPMLHYKFHVCIGRKAG